MLIRKAYKYRIYPNKEQEQALAFQFGCARFVYNWGLAARKAHYEEHGKGINYYDTCYMLTTVKKFVPWLREASNQALKQSLMDLDRAYTNFFKGLACYPKFKSKNDQQSIRYVEDFRLESGRRVQLPKVGLVRVTLHRPIEGKMKNLTVSKTKTGKYFVSIQCEVEIAEPQPRGGAVGIDLGLKDFVTLSTGEKVEAPKYLRKSERRLKIRQRRLSRKAKGSNNRGKTRLQVALQHEKIANQRKDFHHKLSHSLVSRFGFIAFENLNVAGMIQNHSLAKSIQDAGWSEFVGFCEYKSSWTGGIVEKQDRFFASSKTCSDCGWINQALKLSDREWTCLGCGKVHGRDTNAAINLLNKSTLRARETNACGDTKPIGDSAQEVQLDSSLDSWFKEESL